MQRETEKAPKNRELTKKAAAAAAALGSFHFKTSEPVHRSIQIRVGFHIAVEGA